MKNTLKYIVYLNLISGFALHSSQSMESLTSSILEKNIEDFRLYFEEIPYCGKLNKEDISLIFAGPIEKDGREWELTAFKHNDSLKQVMKFDFSVKQLNDDNAFYIEPFEVDTNGEIRYTVSLVSTKIFDEEGFPEQAPLMIKSPLKKNELENPLIKEFMLPYRFEEISFFNRINSVSQMSQISRKRLQNLAFLSKDSMQKETLIQASENLGEDLDSEENNS